MPEAVVFATKPRLAEAMLERALAAAVPCAWVTGDPVYGGDRCLRLFLEAQEQPFVLAVPSNELLCYGGLTYYRASELAARVEPEAWQRRSAGAGSKGPRLYDWTLVKLWRLQRTPQEQTWGHYLLVRRSISDPEALAYYVVFARRRQATLERLVRVAGSRWQIEQAFEAAKGECGLDEYEVRKWRVWHRHMTLSLLAYAFLVVMRAQGQKKRGNEVSELIPLTVPEVRRLLCRLLWSRPATRARVVAWSQWRRRHQRRAQRCHYKRRTEYGFT